MYCEQCGTQIIPNTNFCYKCGKPTNNYIRAKVAEHASKSIALTVFSIACSVISLILLAIILF